MESCSNGWRTNGKNHNRSEVVVISDSHGGQISAANAEAQSGKVAVTAATVAAVTTEAGGGAPFAEGPTTFSAAIQ